MVRKADTSRRAFVAGTALSCGQIFTSRAFGAFRNLGTAPSHPIRIAIDATRTMGPIPSNFTGLGFEISSVASDDLLTSANHTYVQLVRTLGKSGVIRIGGNTSDYSLFKPQGKLISTPKGTIINQESLRRLGSFLDATGWQLIWGLNLGGGTQQNAIEEAKAVASIAKDKLFAFEIGNEPDLFAHEGHRPHGYSYENYLEDYRRFKSALRAELPDIPFAGPDVAGDNEWVSRFAKDEGGDLKLLTHHYYRGGASNPASTLNLLLESDPKLASTLATLRQISEQAHLPFRICETNSFSGGGKPGVSNTFGSALWTLDYMLTLAWGGCSGVNIETGINQLDFISSYSPISDDGKGNYSAAPDYYGMLAFAHAAQGERLALDYDPGSINLTAHATLQDQHRIAITVVNKDASRDAEIELNSKQHLSRASVMRLTGPSLESQQGVTFAGATVAADGTWREGKTEFIHLHENLGKIHVPAGSAAMVFLDKV
ncbi:MAG TPA: glycosyl hydrolase family 79 C-terminal domain-containing protein [Acidobacteriaceae bacterium]